MTPEIQAKIKALEAFQANVNELIVEVMLGDAEAFILDSNTNDQLYNEGITREGVKIESFEPYTPFTISVKRGIGQPYDRVTLKDEGDFHQSFYLEREQDGVKIWAKDGKTRKLIAKYGEEIFGLTDNNIIELAYEYVLPFLLKKLNEASSA